MKSKLKSIGAVGLALMFALLSVPFSITKNNVVNADISGETRYKDLPERITTSSILTLTERIYYHTKRVYEHIMFPATPVYNLISCGVGAGITIVGYYNKWLDLIPNHVAGRWIGQSWSWTTSNQAIVNEAEMINQAMGGHGAKGVTFWEFMGGLGYHVVVNRGHNLFVTTVRENNNALRPTFSQQIRKGRLVALFMSGYNISGNGIGFNNNGVAQFTLTQHSGNHIMTAFGYREVFFYDINGHMFRHEKFVRVQTGISGNGWMRVNANATIDHAIVTYIYYEWNN